MQLFDDIKQYFKCQDILERAQQYKIRMSKDDAYYKTYLTQILLYKEEKTKIKNNKIQNTLQGLEKKLVGEIK